jgi:acetyl esterase
VRPVTCYPNRLPVGNLVGMSMVDRVPAAFQAGVVRTLFSLPPQVRRALAGRPTRVDGQTLDTDIQLLLRLMNLQGYELAGGTPERARAAMDRGTVATGRVQDHVPSRDLRIPGDGGEIPARLYTPDGLPAGSPLVVFYHGGGWVLGGLDSHDGICRFLAERASTRVLAVDYRLAPEHPFPAAVDDSVAAFRYAVANAVELGIDPDAIAVSGDSAGGNLAAAVCHVTARDRTTRPAFALLFYPAVDASTRRRSREVFGNGFLLTDAGMDWFHDYYAPEAKDAEDPRLSVLLSDHLADFPPTYITVGGFDPLRDEDEVFGTRLAEAGVPVVVRLHPDLIHGFTNFIGVIPRAREATAEAVGALATGLALTTAARANESEAV